MIGSRISFGAIQRKVEQAIAIGGSGAEGAEPPGASGYLQETNRSIASRNPYVNSGKTVSGAAIV
jgi:hypothetical protein